MSGVNGDKARFNRKRKQNIARRERNRAMRETLVAPGASGDKGKVTTKKASS